MKTREGKNGRTNLLEAYVELCLWHTAPGIEDIEMQRNTFIGDDGRLIMRSPFPSPGNDYWSPSRCLDQANAILERHCDATRKCHQEKSILNRCLMRRLNADIESLKKDIRINEGCFWEMVGPNIQPKREGVVQNGCGN